MIAMVYINKNISYILSAKVAMHNFSYSNVMIKAISKSPVVANVIIYNWLHVSNSIKPEKRHNDKF